MHRVGPDLNRDELAAWDHKYQKTASIIHASRFPHKFSVPPDRYDAICGSRLAWLKARTGANKLSYLTHFFVLPVTPVFAKR